MINVIKKLISDNKIEESIFFFQNNTFNSHQKLEIFKHVFLNQNYQLIDNFYTKIGLNKDNMEDILIYSNEKNINISNFKYLDNLDDISLFQKIGTKSNLLIKSKNDDFLIQFSDIYPLCTFLNFNKIVFNSFFYNKINFLEHLSKKQIDVEKLFYVGLCCIKFNKKELFSTFLENQIKIKNNIIDELSNYNERYLQNFKHLSVGLKKEDIEDFIDKKTIEGVSIFLKETIIANLKNHTSGKKNKI